MPCSTTGLFQNKSLNDAAFHLTQHDLRSHIITLTKALYNATNLQYKDKTKMLSSVINAV